jgi:hypothetical protein
MGDLDNARTSCVQNRLQRWLRPATLLTLLLPVYVCLVLTQHGLNPIEFAQIGSGFANGQPVGTEGYDGQFSYWLAVDPRPAAAGTHFDVPAYRYQRILYPLIARWLVLGQMVWIPWSLIAVNVIAQVGGTLAVEAWLAAHGLSPWYALTYGLWVGLVAAVRLDLNEPLSYALVAGAFLAHYRGRLMLSALCLGLAMLAKETALVFWTAEIAWAALAKNRRALTALCLAALPFALFQVWLFREFGAIGLTSGGWMATPFEWIPFMGLWRVASVSVPGFVLLAAILLPLVVAPSVWGVGAAAWRLFRRDYSPAVLALGANASLIAVLPFSTFREPLGIVRLSTGLVLCTILFGAHTGSRRVLNYSLLWIAALALIARS